MSDELKLLFKLRSQNKDKKVSLFVSLTNRENQLDLEAVFCAQGIFVSLQARKIESQQATNKKRLKKVPSACFVLYL